MKVAVVGSGSWGSAIAWVLANNGHQVRLWARSAEVANAINQEHRNPRYLTNIILPETISAATELTEALECAEAVILATPSAAVRSTAKNLAALIGTNQSTPSDNQQATSASDNQQATSASDNQQATSANQPTPKTTTAIPLLLLAKGLEIASAPNHFAQTPPNKPVSQTDAAPPKLLLDVLAEELGAPERLAVLSGPNHAEEVAQGMLAGTVIAAANSSVAQLFQQLLATTNFRVYTSCDSVGVQLCGAAKNVIAIAAGMAHGLNLGDNLAAMLMTRGLAEISRLVQACGGQAQTCMGLAGMGDLIVTCSSKHSRNRSFGVAMARGTTLAEYEANTHMVVEGARACQALPALAASKAIEMPISEHVRAAVWQGCNLKEVMNKLLERPFRPEF